MSNTEHDFSTVIKTNISSITKHPLNIGLAVNTTQTKAGSHLS